MNQLKLQLSQTQSLALRLLHDPTVVELLFGGGAGGAKSFIVCIWMVLECRNYPRIRIGLGREELKRLKQTTLVTLLSKVHQLLGVKESEYAYSEQSRLDHLRQRVADPADRHEVPPDGPGVRHLRVARADACRDRGGR